MIKHIEVVIKPPPVVKYPIWIGSGILEQPRLWMPTTAESVVIMTDHHVKKYYGNALNTRLLRAGYATSLFSFQPGESAKNQRTKARLEAKMLAKGCGRDSLILALGGGVVGDLAGFIAATYMRGIPFVQIPTSLLAMLDSSVGGKTGIDNVYGKNLIGAFWQPHAVVTDVNCLATLSRRHLLNGLIEAIKLFLIRDADSFDYLHHHLSSILAYDPSILTEIIHRAVSLKANIVQQDERENHQRAILNFGHTIGHALEQVSNYKLLHGYAVALGILVEAKIAQLMGLFTQDQMNRIQALFAGLDIFPSQLASFDSDTVIQATRSDKKRRAGAVHYVLINQMGQVHEAAQQVVHPVADEVVREAFNYFGAQHGR